jgi:hypothetical protein
MKWAKSDELEYVFLIPYAVHNDRPKTNCILSSSSLKLLFSTSFEFALKTGYFVISHTGLGKSQERGNLLLTFFCHQIHGTMDLEGHHTATNCHIERDSHSMNLCFFL